MKKILFFSNNINKVNEIKKILNNSNIEIVSPQEFNLNFIPKENGKSFAENAKIKSTYGFKELKIPCVADDSGISIEALGWRPNIHSRNFIEKFQNKEECLKYIINKAQTTGKRKAFFQTYICYTLKKNYNICFKGEIRGRISDKILGKRGFGYDPIFIPEGSLKSFGEMSSFEKNLLSHRAIAIKKFISFLSN